MTPNNKSGAAIVGVEITVSKKKVGIAKEHLTSQRGIMNKADSKPNKQIGTRAMGVEMTTGRVNHGIRKKLLIHPAKVALERKG